MAHHPPLDELRVVDASVRIAGAYTSKLFADLGAEVVMLEPPTGHPLRSRRATTIDPSTTAPLFVHLCGGKRSLVGTLDDPDVAELLRAADLLVDDATDADGIAALRALFPHLVVVSISPWGRTGPLRSAPGTDLTVQAEAGGMKFRGPRDLPPLRGGGDISEYLTGAAAAAPALAAVLRARSTGEGAWIDCSMHDVMAIAGSNYYDLLDSMMGHPPRNGPLRIVDTPGIERASDGLVGLNTNAGHMFQMFLVMIDRGDLVDDPDIARLNTRIAMGDEWRAIVDPWMSSHTVAEVVEMAGDLRVPVAPVHTGATVVDDEQFVARRLFEHHDGIARIRSPFHVDGERPPLRSAPAIDDARDARRPLRPRSPARGIDVATGLPLAGLRVVDLTSWWVGGMATQVLADLGAEVIHIESTAHPDGMRLTGFALGHPEWWEWGHMFTAASANKEAITLDLSAERGASLLRELIATSDVLVENFAPRVTENWGLGFDEVSEINPDVVHLRMPAFGLDGPWRDRPAFAQIIEPMSTMVSITGHPGARPVAKGGLPDPLGAWHGAFAAMAGIAALRAGRPGTRLESCMAEVSVNACPEPALEWMTDRTLLGVTGNRDPHLSPNDIYPCVGDDEWVAISITNATEWMSLCRVIGADDLADDPTLLTTEGRTARCDEIDERITKWSMQSAPQVCADILRESGVPVGVVRDPRDLSIDPHLIARSLYEDVDHPVVGRHPIPGLPLRMSGVDRWRRRPAPTIGQDNDVVLARVLGLSAEEIADLRHHRIIGERPDGL